MDTKFRIKLGSFEVETNNITVIAICGMFVIMVLSLAGALI